MHETRWIMRAAVALLIPVAAHTQQQPSARVEFEVVSVKPGDPASRGSSSGSPPGRLTMRNTTLKNLVMSAYGLNEFQITGGPAWMDSAKFNIDAKLPEGAPQSQMPLMLQTMLADRFNMASHRESRIFRHFALTVANGGPKLRKASAGDHGGVVTSQSSNQITGWGRPISDLAGMLISVVGAPVVDQTELKGQYDFDIKFAPLAGASNSADDALPDVFTVLQKQLGLKLEAIKGPVEVLVIDRAERPTGN